MENIERDLIILLLKLTRCGPASHEVVNREAKIPSSIGAKLLEKLQNDDLLYVHKEFIEVDSFKRVKLAVRAVSLGADPENVSRILEWQEFEGIAAVICKGNHYDVHRNLRFKQSGHRYEIDIIACKKPLAVCVDCKHWQQGMYPSALKTVVREQVERVEALVRCLPSPAIKIQCSAWDEVKMVPAVLSLTASSLRFLDDVPIVPILQFQDFLIELPAHVSSLKHFSVVASNFKDGLLRQR